jgi:hypothetical protein
MTAFELSAHIAACCDDELPEPVLEDLVRRFKPAQ